MRDYTVHRCPVCGSDRLRATAPSLWLNLICEECETELRVKNDPDDAPGIRARIDVVGRVSARWAMRVTV
jgi:uncharacterized protein (DUF983 family)